MFKMFTLTVIVLLGFISSQTYAQKTIKLNPNETKVLTNSTLWTLNATCTVQNTSQKKSKIKISVLKNSGKVNGKNLATGQTTMVTVSNNSSISVSAESGTQINLMNLSSEGLQAVCYT
jgi:hypothetical protein